MIVVGAAADIARHCRSDFVRGRMRVACKQPFGAHELPRGAESTLRSVVFNERLLKWIEMLIMRETLDGLDLSPVGPHRKIAARVDWLAVQQHRTGSAFAAVAADLRARQAKVIAQ